jgi:hypothetical protein
MLYFDNSPKLVQLRALRMASGLLLATCWYFCWHQRINILLRHENFWRKSIDVVAAAQRWFQCIVASSAPRCISLTGLIPVSRMGQEFLTYVVLPKFSVTEHD